MCPICGRPANDPWRVHDGRGRVVEGCVGEAHTGHLVSPSESARWHNRPEARELRRRERQNRLKRRG